MHYAARSTCDMVRDATVARVLPVGAGLSKGRAGIGRLSHDFGRNPSLRGDLCAILAWTGRLQPRE